MKKIFFVFILLLIASILTFLSVIAYRYYAKPELWTAYKTAQHDDDTLRIAYIGDSWAYMHEKHQCKIPLIEDIQAYNPTIVYSYGLGGRTSKEIYEALFNDKSLRKLLQEQGCNYCFISVGINDINKKMSIQYYQDSMDYIIDFLLSNNIHPIILEIPDFDVLKAYRGLRFISKQLRKLSMSINNVPMDCKQMYRDALDSLIVKKNYHDKVSIIRYKSWNNNYSNDQKTLYLKDGIHLNEYGYHVLDTIIVQTIISNMNNYENRY